MSELDPFRIVECHYPYRADEPVVLVSAAAQSVLGSDLGSSLVPDLARRVRDLVHPGLSQDADAGVAALTLSDGRQICGVCGRYAVILGAPEDLESDLSTSLGADEVIGPGPDDNTYRNGAQSPRTDLRSQFRETLPFARKRSDSSSCTAWRLICSRPPAQPISGRSTPTIPKC
jgi:hypothetical protein